MFDLNAIHKDNREYNHIPHIFRSPILINWGWAIAFFIICAFNGWILNLSSASLPLVIYFAIFPLGISVYVFSRNTKVLTISLMISQAILAFAICSLEPNSSIIPSIFYSINLCFFAFILTCVAKENGTVISVLILCSTVILPMIFGWEWIGRIVWYYNLTFTANKAEKKMKKFIDNFDSTMLALCGIAALGLAVGWRFADVSS